MPRANLVGGGDGDPSARLTPSRVLRFLRWSLAGPLPSKAAAHLPSGPWTPLSQVGNGLEMGWRWVGDGLEIVYCRW